MDGYYTFTDHKVTDEALLIRGVGKTDMAQVEIAIPRADAELFGWIDPLEEEETGVQTFHELLQAHPALKAHLTLLFNHYHNLATMCLDDLQKAHMNTVDVTVSLAKRDAQLQELGIPLLTTYAEWKDMMDQRAEGRVERES